MTEKPKINNRLVREFTKELKNPMGGIRGAAQLLQMELGNNLEFKEYTQIIIQEIDRVKEKVDKFPDVLLDDSEAILRSIEFLPEHKQAGISLLTYFGEIIQQKYPDADVTFRIEQYENKVTLIVMAKGKELERIERLLSDYGAVLEGEKPAEELLPNLIHSTQLNHKVEMAALELRMTKELYQQHSSLQTKRIDGLEVQIQMMTSMLGRTLKNQPDIVNIIELLVPHAAREQKIDDALGLLTNNIVDSPTIKNKDSVKNAFSIIKQNSPNLLTEITDILKGTVSGASGNLTASWIMSIINSLPK